MKQVYTFGRGSERRCPNTGAPDGAAAAEGRGCQQPEGQRRPSK